MKRCCKLSNCTMKIFFFLVILIAIVYVTCQYEDVSDVTFIVLRGLDASNLDPLKASWDNISSLLNSSFYDNTKKTIIYCYGYMDTFDTDSVQEISKAFAARRSDLNIFVVDLGKYAGGNYVLDAIPNLIKVSKISITKSQLELSWIQKNFLNFSNRIRLERTSVKSFSKCQISGSASINFTSLDTLSELISVARSGEQRACRRKRFYLKGSPDLILLAPFGRHGILFSQRWMHLMLNLLTSSIPIELI